MNELYNKTKEIESGLSQNQKPILVVLTGAGISAESGIPTFRDANGLWEGHDVMQVASPFGWQKNKELVLRFYNQRRNKLGEVKPNKGHLSLVDLEQEYHVIVITQNVDDLHERAGSTNIIHLHGELTKARSTVDEDLIYNIGYKDINLGDLCEKGSQLRPHIVWFHEEVPMMYLAEQVVEKASVLMVVGTSLQVYPAAGLIYSAPPNIPIYVIDRKLPYLDRHGLNLKMIEEPATIGIPIAIADLKSKQ